MLPFHYIIFSVESYSLAVLWSLGELQVLVWLEVVVMLAAPFFSCLSQQRPLLVKSHGNVKLWQWYFISEIVNINTVLSEVSAVKLILLVTVFQDEFSEWWLWIHAFFLIPCYCNTGREERVVLEREAEEWRVRYCALFQLICSHNLSTRTEDTWLVYDWLSLDELSADPADVTV